MKQTLIGAIALSSQWRHDLRNTSGKEEWIAEASFRLDSLDELLPSGSGVYNVKIIRDKSSSQKVEISFMYHFMNGDGYYDGHEGYRISVKPDLAHGYRMNIYGNDRAGIKDYFYDIFSTAFDGPVLLGDDGKYSDANDNRFFKIENEKVHTHVQG